MVRSEPYFMVRVPLLPYQQGRHSSEADLKKLFSQPILQEALFLASPTLYDRLRYFLADTLPDHESKRICLSLNKYLLRLSSRCTPFGLFAGVIKGGWSDRTHSQMHGSIQRCSRLDTEYIAMLVESLLAQPEINSKVKFFPNDTIYVVDNKIRYLEYGIDRQKRMHQLSDIESNAFLLAILTLAKDGKDKVSLAQNIVNSEITFEEAISFVDDIIQNQLLVSELEVRLTGNDYFTHICDTLRSYNICLSLLEEIEGHLKELDQRHSEDNLRNYPVLINKLKQLATVEDSSHYIQVDVKMSADIEIHRSVAATIENIVELLAGILPHQERKTIESFKRAFFDRYEFKSIDLCTALDPEVGLGYPIRQSASLVDSSLLSDIDFQEEEKSAIAEFSDFQQFLLQKYSEVLQSQKPVVLRKEELLPFSKPAALPNSLYAFAAVYGSSSRAVDEGDFQIQFHGAFGPSAVPLMARFCHLDNDWAGLLKETLNKEALQKEAIFAEVIHANHPRTGNISTRAVLSDYEIPVLARSGVDEAHTIPISDLTIGIVGGRLVLRSKKLNKEIIPRLSSAHNFSHNTVSVYRFLCDLQYQGVTTSLKWDWGILKSFPFLPSVKIGNVILSPARWKLFNYEIAAIKNADNVQKVVEAIRTKRNIPCKVIVGHLDNKIVVDLENENHLYVFQKLIESTDILEECYLAEDKFFIRDKANAGYVHELIVPLTNTVKGRYTHNAAASTTLAGQDTAHREFALGSEWLYYKIYCNSKAVDQVLLELVKPLTDSLLQEAIIDKWFFIRYSDPRNHIRLRLHGQNSFYQKVIERLYQAIQPYIKKGLITSIETDTYKRELERYGLDMIASESLFFVDSASTLQLLAQLEDREDLRWQMALLGANELFSVFDIPLNKRREITLDLQQQFFKEMKVNQALKRSLASSMRSNKKTIEDVLYGNGLTEVINQIMTQRSQRLQPIATAILGQSLANTLSLPVESLLKSYLHMWFNRMFQSHPRHHEMVLYDYLFQFYNSQLAKNKGKDRITEPLSLRLDIAPFKDA